jgi:hypothetical protein
MKSTRRNAGNTLRRRHVLLVGVLSCLAIAATKANVTTFGPFVLGTESYLGRYANVTLVEVEMASAGPIRLEVRKDGKVLSRGQRANEHGGWSTFSFAAGMVPPVSNGWSPYAIHLVNASGGTKQVKQINVHGGPRLP